jgi:hypothetical protein
VRHCGPCKAVCVCDSLTEIGQTSDTVHCTPGTDGINPNTGLPGYDAGPVGVHFPVFRFILLPSSSGSSSPTRSGCFCSLL